MQTTDTAINEPPSRSKPLPECLDQPPPQLATGGPGLADDEPLYDDGLGIPLNAEQISAAVAKLPPAQAAQVTWLYQVGRDNGWDLTRLASNLRRAKKGTYSPQTLYAVLRGRYYGAMDQVVAAIKAFRSVHEQRERIVRPDFIQTNLSRQMWAICDRARSYNRLATVFGDGQIGKSKSLEEYQRQHKVNTRYLRLPTGAPVRVTVQMLAQVCHLNTNSHNALLRMRIIEHFDSQMLLIVDELQQITLAQTSRDRLMTVEFLREIFDRSGCGMVLCGTNEAMKELADGPNALWLRQLRRRALPKIALQSVASDGDILAFAAHFGLHAEMPPDAVRETRQIASEDGVGLLITYLQGAARMAATEQCPVTWNHFLRTVKAFNEQVGTR